MARVTKNLTNGNDDVDYGGSNQDIFAFNGDDRVLAGGGDDYVDGGNGEDTLKGESGKDTLVGAEGADVLEGGGGADLIYGDEEMHDEIADGSNHYYNYGADWIDGGDGDDEIHAGGGDDIVYGDHGADLIYGGAGSDHINGGNDKDTIYGGSGHDTIDGGDNKDNIWGGDGNDRLRGGNAEDTVKGGNGDDTLFGEEGDDQLIGNSGDDEIFGGHGFDTITGGNGVDSIEGGDNQDIIYTNNDTSDGDGDADNVDGGNAADSIYGNSGDHIQGGSGDDHIVYHANDLIGGYINAQSGEDHVHIYVYDHFVGEIKVRGGQSNGGSDGIFDHEDRLRIQSVGGENVAAIRSKDSDGNKRIVVADKEAEFDWDSYFDNGEKLSTIDAGDFATVEFGGSWNATDANGTVSTLIGDHREGKVNLAPEVNSSGVFHRMYQGETVAINLNNYASDAGDLSDLTSLQFYVTETVNSDEFSYDVSSDGILTIEASEDADYGQFWLYVSDGIEVSRDILQVNVLENTAPDAPDEPVIVTAEYDPDIVQNKAVIDFWDILQRTVDAEADQPLVDFHMQYLDIAKVTLTDRSTGEVEEFQLVNSDVSQIFEFDHGTFIFRRTDEAVLTYDLGKSYELEYTVTDQSWHVYRDGSPLDYIEGTAPVTGLLDGLTDTGLIELESDEIHLGNASTTTAYGSSNDAVFGEGGNDVVDGGGGHDWIDGGSGDDKLYGEGGDDVIKGGSGDDQLRGGGGMDTLSGNEGNDKYFHAANWGTSIVVEQGSGTDTVKLGGLVSDGSTGEAWELVVENDELQFIYADRQASNGDDRGVFIVDALTDSNGDGTLDEHDANVIEEFQFDDVTVGLHELLEMTGNSGIIDENNMLL